MSMISKIIGEKRRWREYRGRVKQLPENYREALDAVQHYLMYFGPADGKSAAQMFDDLADLFERAAVDGTTIREIVGEDPVEFADAFAENYRTGGWVTRERDKLIKAIDHAAGETTTSDGKEKER